jgi:biopolymer transport protein ExbD
MHRMLFGPTQGISSEPVMKIRHTGQDKDEPGIQMTAMIDIVFLLLVFFVMTFKIIAPEGDFNIKMPSNAAQGPPPPDATLPPIKIRIIANSSGDIEGIRLAESSVTSMNELRTRVRGLIGDAGGPGALESTEIEFDCDYNLKYQYVVQAMTAVSGYVDQDSGQIVKLVEKIKFTPPQKSL